MSKYFDWDKEKNELLKITRGVSFEEIQAAIESGGLLDRIDHPNQKRYPGQRMLVVKLRNYVYLVPFVEDDEKVFLKTAYPNRKANKKYLKNEKQKK